MKDWNRWEYDSTQGQMFLLHHVTRWTNQKKLDQSSLFTTVSTQSDSVSDLTFEHHSPFLDQFLCFAYARVNKVDVLQHENWVSEVVNLVSCHVQFFSNNPGEPYGDNTGCQFQSLNWNFYVWDHILLFQWQMHSEFGWWHLSNGDKRRLNIIDEKLLRRGVVVLL